MSLLYCDRCGEPWSNHDNCADDTQIPVNRIGHVADCKCVVCRNSKEGWAAADREANATSSSQNSGVQGFGMNNKPSSELQASTVKDHAPRCPQCGGPLTEVRQVAGDYYCETCPDNGRAQNGKAYFWKRELKREANSLEANHP